MLSIAYLSYAIINLPSFVLHGYFGHLSLDQESMNMLKALFDNAWYSMRAHPHALLEVALHGSFFTDTGVRVFVADLEKWIRRVNDIEVTVHEAPYTTANPESVGTL